ncbi:MAG: DNA repair exonuclease [Clostridiales bacterium]|nr:DNA repair exonuclease [Clostridiales bacterium]
MPRKIRVIHAADLHLGSPFSTLPTDHANTRRAEQEQTFYDLIRLCKERRTQILLIAGDLLDGSRVSQEQRRNLARAFEEIPDTRVFVSPGNHDPYIRRCPYETDEWPENVYVFKGDWESVKCDELKTVVWGAGFRAGRQTTTLCPPDFHVSMLEDTEPDAIHLVVLHGEIVSGKKAESSYNPIRTSWIEKSGADYVALGHVHDPTIPVLRAGRTYYAYSGCPEARGYDEAGPRGVFAGTIGKGRVELEYIYLNKRSFYTVDVPVDECGTQKEILDTVVRFLRDKYAGEFEKSAYRITLIGAIPPDFTPNTAALRNELREMCFDARVYDKTTAMIDLRMLRKEKSIRGVFADILWKKREEAEATSDAAQVARIDAALKLGLAAFEKEVRYIENT